MTPRISRACFAAALLVSASLCLGQPAAGPKPSPVSIQGSLRTRLESWDWFGAAGAGSYLYSGSLARLSLGQQFRTLDWQVEFAAPFLIGLPGTAIAAPPQGQLGLGGSYFAANDRSRHAGMAFVKQGFVRLKGGSHSLRLGRFEFNDGTEVTPKDPTLATLKRTRVAQRLIGAFGFSHVGRSLDGAQYSLNRPGGNVTVVAALPTRGVFQVDGWGNLRTAVAYAAATKPVASGKSAGEVRVFGIYYQDWRRVLKTDNRAAAARAADTGNVRIGTFGGHYIHAAQTAAGTLDFLFWGAAQTGRWGTLDHRAGAAAVEAGYQPRCALKPWLRAGLFHSTGDGDTRDSSHGTFFQIMPTPRIYAQFPFYNLMNNRDLFATLALRPHKALSLAGGVHSLRLAERADLWYLGGGAFQPWSFGYVGRPSGGNRGLATVLDVSADYAVNSHVTLSGYVAHAAGKSVVASIYPDGRNARFGYIELTWRF